MAELWILSFTFSPMQSDGVPLKQILLRRTVASREVGGAHSSQQGAAALLWTDL